MHFPASFQPSVNAPMVMPGAPMVQTGRPDVRTGAPTQLGCGVVGIGCDQHMTQMSDALAFGADPVIASPGWPMWAKVLLGVSIFGAIGTAVYFATR